MEKRKLKKCPGTSGLRVKAKEWISGFNKISPQEVDQLLYWQEEKYMLVYGFRNNICEFDIILGLDKNGCREIKLDQKIGIVKSRVPQYLSSDSKKKLVFQNSLN